MHVYQEAIGCAGLRPRRAAVSWL